MIDEVIFINESPSILSKFLSSIYSLMLNHLNSKKQISKMTKNDQIEDVEEPVNESPINVFHYNKENLLKKHNSTSGKSRVQIITPRKSNVVTEIAEKVEVPLEKSEAKPDSKMSGVKNMLRRIEFYFRWLNSNEANLKKIDRTNATLSCLELAKKTLTKDIENFNSEKQLIERNMHELRKQQNNSTNKKLLIEEL